MKAFLYFLLLWPYLGQSQGMIAKPGANHSKMNQAFTCQAEKEEGIEIDCTKKGRCSTFIKEITSRLINPSHPKADKCSGSQSHVIHIQESVCNLRLNIESLELQNPPWAKDCIFDFLFVLHENAPTHPLCGVVKSHQVDIRVKEGDTVEILFVTQSKQHSWEIFAEQVACEEIKSDPFPEVSETCGKRDADAEALSNDHRGLPQKTEVIPLEFKLENCIQGSFRCYLEYLIQKEALKRPPKTKIINGYEAKANSWNFMVAMLKDGKSLLCGGSLVSKNIILTAGHCVAFDPNKVDVRKVRIAIGAHNLDKPGDTIQLYKIDKIIKNPGYDFVTNDIALIRLEKGVDLTGVVGSVCLPKSKGSYAGEQGWIVGWGLTAGSKVPSPTLQEAKIPIVENDRCQKDWAEFAGSDYSNIIDKTNICAGGKEAATCNGDSGGPLVVKNGKGRYEQVGLVSFGPTGNCYIPGKVLSVFTRVSEYVDWMARAVARSFNDLQISPLAPIPTYSACSIVK